MSRQSTPKALDFVQFFVARFKEDRCLQVAASLAFTTLLSLVPLLTIALALASPFPVFSEFSVQFKIFLLTHLAPEAAGKIITVYMQQFSDNAGRLTAAGVTFLALTAMALMLTIDRAFNAIWRVSRPRPLLNRLLIYWAVLTLGPLLIGAGLSLTSWLVGASMGFARALPGGARALLGVASVLPVAVAFTLMFMIVPNRPVPWAHAAAGGLCAAIAFELASRGFGLYIARFSTYKLVYGAFAAIPIFLVWIYISWLVVLAGAVLAASLCDWTPRDWRRSRTPAERFHHGLRLLKVLSEGLKTGRVANLGELARELRLGFAELEALLETFASAGWVRRVVGGGWTLVREPAEIRVGDVYRLFVFDLKTIRVQENELAHLMKVLEEGLNAKLDASLKECFAPREDGTQNTRAGQSPPFTGRR